MDINIIRLSRDRGLEDRLRELNSKKLIYCQEKGSRRWNWQYLLNPFSPGQDLSSWIAVSGNETAGHLGCIPVKLKVGSRLVDAAWAVDFVTSPEYRRKGVGRLLTEEAAKEYGLLLTVGQTDASFNLFLKMGWKLLGDVPYCIKILDLKFLAKGKIGNMFAANIVFALPNLIFNTFNRLKNPKQHPDIEIGRIEKFGEDADLFWQNIADSYKIAVSRDSLYLNWKYVGQPGMDYVKLCATRGKALCGCIIIRTIKSGADMPTGLIADLIVRPDDKDAIGALLAAALQYFRDEKCSAVRCYATNQSLQKALKEHGFMRRKVTMRFLVNKYLDEDGEMGMLDNWHLMAGDCDIDRPS